MMFGSPCKSTTSFKRAAIGSLRRNDSKKVTNYFSNVSLLQQSSTSLPPRFSVGLDSLELYSISKRFPGGITIYKPRKAFDPIYPVESKLKGQPRSKSNGFTTSSRRNLRGRLISLDLEPFMREESCVSSNGFFLSLDWPLDADLDPKSVNKCLEKLRMQLCRDFQDTFLGAVWKKELKSNGMLHVHLVVLFNQDIETCFLREWVTSLWSSIVKRTLQYGVDVRALYGDSSKLLNYLLKEGNLNARDWNFGNVWGTWNGLGLPLVDPIITGHDIEDHAEILKRTKQLPQAKHSRYLQKINENWEGFTFFSGLGDAESLLTDLPSDELKF
jgi:hypothetical protein